MKLVLAGCALAVALTSPVIAQDVPARPSEIAATGRGEITIVPNRAVLTVTVENTATSASTTGAENARIVNATIQSLRSAGVKDEELTNGGYSLSQDYENGDRRRPRGFVARNSVRVEIPRVSDVGKLIDAALAGGATIVSPIQFLGPNMPNARRDALTAAVVEARRDAEALAAASGGSLGRLLSMTTGTGQPYYQQLSEVVVTGIASGGVAMAPTTIRPGDLTIVAVASGRWEFVARR